MNDADAKPDADGDGEAPLLHIVIYLCCLMMTDD